MSNRTIWPVSSLLAALSLGLLLVAACGGATEKTTPAPSPAVAEPTTASTASPVTTRATPTPAATAAPPVVDGDAACRAIKELSSFRFTLRVQLQIPELQPGAVEAGTPGPLDPFTEGLTALLSDLNIQGAYVRPDRSQVTMKVAGEDITVITIGDKEWTRKGTLPWAASAVTPGSSVAFSPDDLCELTRALLLVEGLTGEPETVDSVKTRHYRADNAALSALANLFGDAAELVDPPQSFTTDIWLAEEGQWPLRLNLEAADKDNQGRDVRVAMAMELKDVNSSDIKIEPPT